MKGHPLRGVLVKIMLKRNEEKNGLELYFEDKPAREVIESLKNNRWRWHNAKKCWYTFYSDANEEYAKKIDGGEIPAEVKTEKAEVKNIHGAKVGDIVVCDWGYNMTIIDYYQIIKISQATVQMVQIGTKSIDGDYFSGYSVPNPDDKGSEVYTRRTKKYGESYIVNDRYGDHNCYKWDGQPDYYNHLD